MGEYYYRNRNKVALHGTPTAYKYGCRCPKCRKAAREESAFYRKLYRERRQTDLTKRESAKLRHLMESAKPFKARIHNVGEVEFMEDGSVSVNAEQFHDLPLEPKNPPTA